MVRYGYRCKIACVTMFTQERFDFSRKYAYNLIYKSKYGLKSVKK